MKHKTLQRLFLTAILTFVLVGCGRLNSESIPDYALGKGSYFANPPAGFTAVTGRVNVLSEPEFLGYDEMDRLLQIRTSEVELNGINFLFFTQKLNRQHWDKTGEKIGNENYCLHALINPNGLNNKYLKKECKYSDTYYFVDNEELFTAIEAFNNTGKEKNRQSRFKASKYEDGVKTYHSKVVASVKYIGREGRYDREFQSIYLACGAVVQLFEDDSIYEGDMLDCVVDKHNTIVDDAYEIE